MAEKPVEVILEKGGITIVPWVVDVDLKDANNSPDSIKWTGNRCRIKIEPDHPEHFKPRLWHGYKKNVKGDFDRNVVQSGSYKYSISVLADSQSTEDDVAVYCIDPDYKVDR
jgi:hypothetical protein